eukprot:358412-Chlamydomonas_euryale.AAC.4
MFRTTRMLQPPCRPNTVLAMLYYPPLHAAHQPCHHRPCQPPPMQHASHNSLYVCRPQAPDQVRFSFDDVASDSEAERPKVVDCVLWLKRQYEPTGGEGWAPPKAPPSPADVDMCDQATPQQKSRHPEETAAAPAAVPTAAPPAPVPAAAPAPVQAPVPAAPPAAPPAKPPASHGVAQLLNQFSSLLKADMQPGGTKPDAVDALGPVFHTVLGSLTADYERKLTARDQDFTRMRETIAALQTQVSRATATHLSGLSLRNCAPVVNPHNSPTCLPPPRPCLGLRQRMDACLHSSLPTWPEACLMPRCQDVHVPCAHARIGGIGRALWRHDLSLPTYTCQHGSRTLHVAAGGEEVVRVRRTTGTRTRTLANACMVTGCCKQRQLGGLPGHALSAALALLQLAAGTGGGPAS